MSIKLALLKSGETLISDIKNIYTSKNEFSGYMFKNPHKVEVRKTVLLTEDIQEAKGDLEVILSPWIILSNDTQIVVSPDWVVTIIEPIQTIKEMYEEKVNGKNCKMSFTED